MHGANKRTGVGTGTTISACHLSEYALYPPDYARDVIEQDIGNALAEDDPEMFAILESTARGAGTYAYRLWNKNVELGDQAEWHPILPAVVFRIYSCVGTTTRLASRAT